MLNTHLTVDQGETIQFHDAESIYPDKSNNSNSQSFEQQSSISEESEVLSSDSFTFQRKQIIMSLKKEALSIVKTKHNKDESHAQIQNRKNPFKVQKSDINDTDLMENILQSQKTDFIPHFKLTNEVIIQKIQSEGQIQSNVPKKKKSKPKFRQRKFEKQFKEDPCLPKKQQEYFMKKIQELHKEKQRLLNQNSQKSKIIDAILSKNTQKQVYPLSSGNQTPVTQRSFTNPNFPNAQPQPEAITGNNLEVSVIENDIFSQNQGYISGDSVTTKVKHTNLLQVIHQPMQVFSSLQTNLSGQNEDSQQKLLEIPQIQIDQYPQNKSPSQLYKIAQVMFQKFGNISNFANCKIKIICHSNYNHYLFILSRDKTILWKKDGSFYLGGWSNGLKDGFGFQSKPCKYKYKGFFVEGKKHGKGQLKNINGKRYIGEWVNGKRQGFGKQIDLEGNSYVGYWLNDLYEGKGTYFSTKKGIFTGDFHEGMKHGHIVWYQKKDGGDKFQGKYAYDQKNGYGEYYWENGKYYKGQFSAGFMVNQNMTEKLNRNFKQMRSKSMKKNNAMSQAHYLQQIEKQANGLDTSSKKYKDFQIRNIPKLPAISRNYPTIDLKPSKSINYGINNKKANINFKKVHEVMPKGSERGTSLQGRNISLDKKKKFDFRV